MTNEIVSMNKEVKMTSREVAELTGKSHSHVLRDIKMEIKYITYYNNIDDFFIISEYKDSTGRKLPMYILTEKGKNYMLERYKRHLSHGTKFQKEFEILLEKTLEGIVKIDKQLSVLRYRVDFYIHNLNLAIEYDEEYHTYQKEYDELREKEIKDTLGCTFIRIKKGEELEGLNEILKIIIKSNNQ